MSKSIRITIKVTTVADVRASRDQVLLTGDGKTTFRVSALPRVEVGDQITLALKATNKWKKRRGGTFDAEIIGEPTRGSIKTQPGKVATTEK